MNVGLHRLTFFSNIIRNNNERDRERDRKSDRESVKQISEIIIKGRSTTSIN